MPVRILPESSKVVQALKGLGHISKLSLLKAFIQWKETASNEIVEESYTSIVHSVKRPETELQ